MNAQSPWDARAGFAGEHNPIKRLATCEFRVLPGRVRAVQIKGPCNNRPCETVIRACDRFAELLTCPIGDLAKQPPATQLAFVEARG
jgi:hypothetical protein